MSDGEVRVLPKAVSYYQLNADGTYQSAYTGRPDVYIDDAQAAKIWDPEVSKHIRETYGPIVGIMHMLVPNIVPPQCDTFKYILGV